MKQKEGLYVWPNKRVVQTRPVQEAMERSNMMAVSGALYGASHLPQRVRHRHKQTRVHLNGDQGEEDALGRVSFVFLCP